MSGTSLALCPALEELLKVPGIIGRFGLNLDDPILIFLSIAGSLIPFRVMKSDSIEYVKLRIQNIKGFFAKKQKLVHSSRELSHNDSHYGLGDGKQQIASKENDLENLCDHKLTLDGEELDDQRLVNDLCKDGENVIHLLITKIRAKPVGNGFEVSIEDCRTKAKLKEFFVEPVVVNPEDQLPSLLKELISSTLEGLEKGNNPIKSSDGSGGAYFMQDASRHKYVSVFKPIDEEPMAVNNPHGMSVSVDGEGLKKGTRVGEGAHREVAAYILDYPMTGPRTFHRDQTGFSGVPPTTMVKCLHKDFNHPNGYSSSHENTKIGSLQMFVSNVGTCEDMGYRAFPVDEVHKISVLDIRMANTDRHAGNILVSRDGKDGQMLLTPIDHGYCFPNKVKTRNIYTNISACKTIRL